MATSSSRFVSSALCSSDILLIHASLQDYQGEIDINTTIQAVQKVLGLCRLVRKCPPKRVIIYRNECSDGWLSYVLSYEVPLIKNVLFKFGCKDTKLTLIVASRLQSVRFFREPVCRLWL